MDILFKHFEQGKEKYASNQHLLNSIHMGWYIMAKYYQQTDSNPVYATALLLHPSKRRRYLEVHWLKDWIDPAIKAAKEMWETSYKHTGDPISATIMKESQEPTAYDLLTQSLDVIGSHTIEDEFERFINAAP